MTFATFETQDGRPVELLTFLNGATVFRYTNANNVVTVGADTFEPLEYTRTAPSISKDADDTQLRITLPSINPVVRLYREILQSNITTVTVERFHDNDPDQQVQVFWKGEVGSVTVNNALATILATPFAQGTDELPRFTYQGLCNYFLYEGSTCRIIRNDHRFVAPISGILSPTQITVNGLRAEAAIIDATISGALSSDELDEYWLNGYCEVNGELRRIIRSPAGGSPQDPDTIEIPYKFNNASTGDQIEVFAGCKRDTDICVRKFDNIINYGGWPTVPKINPFTTELPVGTSADTQRDGFWAG